MASVNRSNRLNTLKLYRPTSCFKANDELHLRLPFQCMNELNEWWNNNRYMIICWGLTFGALESCRRMDVANSRLRIFCQPGRRLTSSISNQTKADDLPNHSYDIPAIMGADRFMHFIQFISLQVKKSLQFWLNSEKYGVIDYTSSFVVKLGH